MTFFKLLGPGPRLAIRCDRCQRAAHSAHDINARVPPYWAFVVGSAPTPTSHGAEHRCPRCRRAEMRSLLVDGRDSEK